MARFPYGTAGYGPNENDDPWTKLKMIDRCLEAGEPVPPGLAHWLGDAIRFSQNDPQELLRHLGLKKRPGRSSYRHAKDAWVKWGGEVCYLEDTGENAEAALKAVMDAYSKVHLQGLSRSTLVDWRDTYRAASLIDREER